MEIDANMIRLVDSLNSLEGIDTMSSCGGHADPEIGQAAEGEYYVSFEVDMRQGRPTRAAWASVALIEWAACQVGAAVLVWVNADEPDPLALMFEVKGQGDPDKLAGILEEILS